MQYITTTQLRTKTSELVEHLLAGEELDLIHRSKVIGKIAPKRPEPGPLTVGGIQEIIKAAAKLKLPKLSYSQRVARYRSHLMKKYGKGLS